MVDLKNQYLKIKNEIDSAINEVLEGTDFINGKKVQIFAEELAKYLNIKYVIPCANGTDALQIALMSLDLEVGDEVIVPAFTYVATAEVIGLLRLTPVLVDVEKDSFNIDPNLIEKAITKRTKAIVPVHLYGQSADMEPILEIAQKYNLTVVEDNAQAIGAVYKFKNGVEKKTGTMGKIGCTSFFPTKNLGCYGDGGAIFTDDDLLGPKIKMIANHGQQKKYVHDIIGCNSRLDTIQAAILLEKLKHLEEYNKKRYLSAMFYSENLKDIPQIQTPVIKPYSTHVFHQYTLIVKDGNRNELKKYLENQGIPTMIYYPIPLNEQKAFKNISKIASKLDNTYYLCENVISLPMHTELTEEQQLYICDKIKEFFKKY